jgi:hypothetical protein
VAAIQGTALHELYLTLKQRAILALSQLGQVDHSQEVGKHSATAATKSENFCTNKLTEDKFLYLL